MKKTIGFILTLLLMGLTPAMAQVWSGVGVHAGGSAALLRGNDVGITDDATDRNYGFTIGVYKSIPLGAGFAVRPELMYTQKGGALSFDEMIEDETSTEVDLNFNVDYLEVPVALTYTIPTQSRYLPMLYAGPYASLATRRNISFDADGISDEGDVAVGSDVRNDEWSVLVGVRL
jgi:hypothetical protein